jgi:hypothetical protein
MVIPSSQAAMPRTRTTSESPRRGGVTIVLLLAATWLQAALSACSGPATGVASAVGGGQDGVGGRNPAEAGDGRLCATCKQMGYACGPLDDGCGHTLECGTCTSPQVCVLGFNGQACGEPCDAACEL